MARDESRRDTDGGISVLASCVRLATATVPRNTACPECSGLGWTWIARMLDERERRTAFTEWAAWLADHVRRCHPPSAAERAAALLREHSTGAWTLTALARECGEPRSRLRRTFIDRFGASPLAYLQGVRVVAAIRLSASGGKVEALARDVGYRSKKDLYAALDRWVGRTPLELSRMTAADRERLAARLERLLDRRTDAERAGAQTFSAAGAATAGAGRPSSASRA